MTHDRCQSVSVSIGVLFFLTVCLMLPVPARAGACETWAAKAVSVQGIVEARPAGAARWTTVKLDNTLCPGDMVRVKANGRASLVLSNDTILRLDQNTTVTFSVITQDEPSQLDVLDGIAHFISRVRQSFKVITPFVNAAVEGTEFVVAARTDESQITVFEGRVLARNPQGQIRLSSGQSAVARAGQAPVMRALVRPRDAVQWALYYPPILDYDPERFRGVPAPGQSRLRDSIEAYRRGDAAAALNRIAGLPDTLADARVYTYRASLRLAVGRVEEAKTDLKRALALNPRQSDALALSAMIAVVQNDRAKARSLAEQAVAADPGSATAKLALSYAQQAEFDIEGALASVQQAIDHQPNNALAWARLAELRLSLGELKQALLTARRATEINPMLARTQSVLGFAYLTQIKVKKAKQAFQRAIELDQSDPLSRLGLGLATIRQGELEAGRRQIELAASLDPNNSLIRSYLGKAYYEEKRDRLAADQLAMAKDLDPNDPTPWFYDAIRKQSINRPVAALRDLDKSVALNDNRAVYRSRLLLDQDEAARSVSLARIYNDLGFRQLALVEGWKSVNTDPANYSSHRFLSDSYATLSGQKVARVSELLQAQLLQPLNINPIQPQLAESALGIFEDSGPSTLSFNEFNPLFTSNGVSAQLNGIIAGDNTWGDDFVVSGIQDKLSYSIGQFHYETDGWREDTATLKANSDQEQDLYNAFLQFALSPHTNIQTEFRYLSTEQGDISDPYLDDYNDTFRGNIETDSYRLGLRHSFNQQSQFILSIIKKDFNAGSELPLFPFFEDRDEDSYLYELQEIYISENLSIMAGIGYYDEDFQLIQSVPPTIISDIDTDTYQKNGYLYTQIKNIPDLNITLGASIDDWKGAPGDKRDQVNPKFGLLWTPTNDTTFRLAGFRTLTRNLVSDQTIEPTQVAGFNQFFEDVENGADSTRYGMGLDNKITSSLFGGLEFSLREIIYPPYKAEHYDSRQQIDRGYLYWIISENFALSSEVYFDRYTRHKESTKPKSADPEIETHRVSLAANTFFSSGISTNLKAEYAYQEFDDGSSITEDKFWILDAALAYRFPKRYGIWKIGIRNLLDKDFVILDNPENPNYYPKRFVFTQFTFRY